MAKCQFGPVGGGRRIFWGRRIGNGEDGDDVNVSDRRVKMRGGGRMKPDGVR